jgi:ATP-binding cassette subfamily F protein uup
VVALLGDGKLSFLGGGVEEYLARVRAVRDTPAGRGLPGPAPARPETPSTSAGQERAARKELQRLERQLERLSVREAELTEQLAANATDYEKLTALGAELRSAQAEKSDVEERWLTVAAEFET